MQPSIKSVDFVVVGSGIAGLRAALELAPAGEVLVLTKAGAAEGSTGYAQGGIAAAVGDDDSAELHARDTEAAGDGLCDADAVRALVTEGPAYVRELMAWGARFDRDEEGRVALAREGGHSVRRVLHARDATGREIARTLWARVKQCRHVRVVEHAFVWDLLVHDGRCAGAWFTSGRDPSRRVLATATLLATGGAGQVYRETTNPPVATGDGVAIAYRAGARVADLEFVQFHPTALNVRAAPRFLLSEALRGEGARLVNEAGEAFMTRYDPAAELAPRDRVARAIAREAERTGGPIYLTMAHLAPAFVRARFPLITEACARAGLDLARDRVPIGPAAHYVMGGVATTLDGHSTIPGLYAAGEVACTGVHGANRLASNSLLEGLVFGARAGRAMLANRRAGQHPPSLGAALDRTPVTAPVKETLARAGIDEQAVRDVMWRHVGLFRDRAGLEEALEPLESAWREVDAVCAGRAIANPSDWRTIGLVTVARLMARAALRRRESRGSHFRSDFPDRDDLHWKRHISERRQETEHRTQEQG